MSDEVKKGPLSIEVVVNNKYGMHLRCCNEITRLAMGFKSTITISNSRRKADAKSMLGLATLAAPKGSKVTVTAEGEDAAAALTAMETFFAAEGEE